MSPLPRFSNLGIGLQWPRVLRWPSNPWHEDSRGNLASRSAPKLEPPAQSLASVTVPSLRPQEWRSFLTLKPSRSWVSEGWEEDQSPELTETPGPGTPGPLKDTLTHCH